MNNTHSIVYFVKERIHQEEAVLGGHMVIHDLCSSGHIEGAKRKKRKKKEIVSASRNARQKLGVSLGDISRLKLSHRPFIDAEPVVSILLFYIVYGVALVNSIVRPMGNLIMPASTPNLYNFKLRSKKNLLYAHSFKVWSIKHIYI